VNIEQEIEKKYAEALNAFDNEEYEEAVKILLPLLKSGHSELFHLLGSCYFNLREPLKALLALKECQEELPQDTDFLYLLGMTYQELFLSELAINAFQRLLKMGDKHEEVYFSLLSAFYEADRMDELIEMAKEALIMHPKSDRLWFTLGITYLLKHKQDALLIEKELRELSSPLASQLHDLIEKDDPETDKKEEMEAKQRAEDHLQRAEELMNHSEPDAVVKELLAALESDQDLPIADTLLGKIYDDYGLIDEGLSMHQMAIKKDPDCAVAYNNLAYVLQIKEEYDQAIEAYKKALALDPYLVEAHNCIGVLYDNLGEYKKGLLHFNQAVKLDPDRETTWENLAFAYWNLRKFDDAIVACKTAIKLNPVSFARIRLASIYRELGRYEDAKADLLELLTIDSESLCAWVELAHCYAESGEEEQKLLTAFERVKSLPARSLPELFSKASFIETVDKEMAIECWSEYIKAAQHNFAERESLSFAKERLEKLIGLIH